MDSISQNEIDNKEEIITAFPLVDFFIVSNESVNDSLKRETILIFDPNFKNLVNNFFEFVIINNIIKTPLNIHPRYKLIVWNDKFRKNNPPNKHKETSPIPV